MTKYYDIIIDGSGGGPIQNLVTREQIKDTFIEYSDQKQEIIDGKEPDRLTFSWEAFDAAARNIKAQIDEQPLLTPSGDVQERAKELQWVKASDKIPLIWSSDEQHYKLDGRMVSGCFYKNKHGDLFFQYYDSLIKDYQTLAINDFGRIQWLDESGASSMQGEVEQLRALFTEFVVRTQRTFPVTEEQLKWFDEETNCKLPHVKAFMHKVFETLDMTGVDPGEAKNTSVRFPIGK